MNWYQTFNTVEGVLWWVVAGVILARTPQETPQQRCGARLAVGAFLAFGLSDFLEASQQGAIPLWLWGIKVLCGCAILAARYTWLGWSRFRWTDREILFGLGCLFAVVLLVVFQPTV